MNTQQWQTEAGIMEVPKVSSIPATMKAAVITKPETIELQEVPVPEIDEDEVLVKLEGCGVCVSNLPVYEGREWFSYPFEAGAPGHEGWGEVVKTGSNITKVQPGDRVAMLSYHAYAQYDKAKEHEVVKLPSALDHLSFPGEPLGCTVNIFKRSDVQSGHNVAIVGIGFLGALLISQCKRGGARVIAISRKSSALDLAKEMGADEMVLMDDHWKIIEKVKELTSEKLCDRVIEATGKEWPLNLSGELVKERGKLIIAGFHQDGMRQINIQLWNWKGIDVINAHERDPHLYIEGIENAIKATEAKIWNLQDVFTHRYSLENIGEAFKMLKKRPEGFIKALIKM